MAKQDAVPRSARILAIVGLAGHLAVGLVPYAGTGLVTPPWAMVVLWGVWLGLLVLAVSWRTRHPRWVPAVPALALGIWVGFVSMGELLLGWTA